MPTQIKRTPTQQFIFLGVAVLLCAQVGWWLGLQIRESKRAQEARIETLKAGRAEAWQLDSLRILPYYYQPDPTTHTTGSRALVIEGKLPVVLPTLEERKRAIEAQFPHVEVVAIPVAEDDPPLVDQAAYLTLRQEPLRQMERERRRAIWVTAGEGTVMALAVLAGFFLIYKKLTEEMDLKLRQRNFIAAVTHELKTPIASIRVWMETLFQRELSSDQKVRIHDLMDKDLERLADLVGNMLDVARADAGSLEIRPEPLELAPLVQGIAEGMDQRLGPGALGLKLDLSPGVWVQGDAGAITTVVENLLSNAYKYASEPRQTTVTLDGNGDEAIVVVSDRGKGIPARELPRLFQRFYRVGDEMTRQVPGTGLGLFLAREIVALHGGDIRVGSRGPGLGSSFTIRLPRLRRQAVPA
jgi:signal transduction histidine kinase